MLHRYLQLLGLVAVLLFSDALAQSYTIVVPAAPGGTAGGFAEAIKKALLTEGLAQAVEVRYLPDRSGAPAILEFAKRRGDASQLILMTRGSGLILSRLGLSFADFTPVARMFSTPQIIAVAANSPYKTLSELMEAFKARPSSIIWGGRTLGGPANITVGQIARLQGIPYSEVRYLGTAGGAKTVQAMLGGELTAIITGFDTLDEFARSGKVRMLGISSREFGLDLPTFREEGLEHGANDWFGLATTAGVSPNEKARLQTLIAQIMRSRVWQEEMRAQRWSRFFAIGSTFDAFLAQETQTFGLVLREMGLIK